MVYALFRQVWKKATHLCPCGYFNHPEKKCGCAPGVVQKYLNRISGPLLDRIDLHIEVTPVNPASLSSTVPSETSSILRERVIVARSRQLARFATHPPDGVVAGSIHCNAQMTVRQLHHYCRLPTDARELLSHAMKKLQLSARAYERIIKVSRTVADLEGADNIALAHVAEAIQYRTLDRESWGRHY